MTRLETPDGTEYVLRPRGAGRWLGIPFLLVWIAGWAVGEAVVLAIVLSRFVTLPIPPGWPRPPASVPPAALAFLLVWLTVWTLGGFGAIFGLLRLVFGRDRVLLAPYGIVTRSGVLGGGRRREHFRETLRAAALEKEALVLHLDGGKKVTAASLGARDERRELLDEIRVRYGLKTPEESLPPPGAPVPLPPDWEAELTPRGEWALRMSAKKRRQTTGCLLTLAGLTAAGFALWGASGLRFDPILVAVASVGVVLALFFAAAREEFVASGNRLELRRGAGPWRWSRSYVGASLRLTFSFDSDGDEWSRLEVVDPRRSSRIWSGLNDRPAAILLGRWLAEKTGWRLETS